MNEEDLYDKKLIGLEFITSSYHSLETLDQQAWYHIRSGDGEVIEQINVYKVIVIHYEVLDGFLTFTTEDYDTIGINIFEIREFRASYEEDVIAEIRKDINEMRDYVNSEENDEPNLPQKQGIRMLINRVKNVFK